MEIKIERVWNGELNEYKEQLDKLKATYGSDENGTFATIEITYLNELFTLSKDLNTSLLISEYKENTIQIYDDYIE